LAQVRQDAGLRLHHQAALGELLPMPAQLRKHPPSGGRQLVELLDREVVQKGDGLVDHGIGSTASRWAILDDLATAVTIRDWQVIIPDFGTVAGPFQIAAFELTGRHDGEVAFELSLESAGELTFTAA
jgi:tail tube protein